MEKLKLTIDQLKNYLGTDLKGCFTFNGNDHYRVMSELTIKTFAEGDSESKLIFYRLSDLDKFIPELGFVPIEKIRDMGMGHVDWITIEREHWIDLYGFEWWVRHIPFGIMSKLIQWHFWPFGEEYFDQGLVIDKMKNEKS